uniref:Uncharacterized protein n=1 Tax=Anguilla anguilla TaxID=7936 RepID=A0A0E9QX58_ANGAN
MVVKEFLLQFVKPSAPPPASSREMAPSQVRFKTNLRICIPVFGLHVVQIR